jgi:glycosyltransferase involved in cell wall biosynthesis
MRILLAPIEIAGQMAITARALRKLDLHAVSCDYGYKQTPYGYTCDVNLGLNEKNSKVMKTATQLAFFLKSAFRYDVFHFNFGKTLLKKGRDIPFLRRLGKKVVMEFWGSDIRVIDESEQGPQVPDANLAKKNSALVADLELKAYVGPFFKRVELVPQRIELDRFQPNFPDPARQRPLIVHAPTHRPIKGTDYVMEAVEALQSKYAFDFRLIEGMKHSEAKRLYENADVVVDQLRLGTYGVFAVESMALGKPVISYIQEEFRKSYPPSLPIQSASRDTIGDVLERMIADGVLRHNLGIKSRKYAEDYHDSIKVAERLVSIYQSI